MPPAFLPRARGVVSAELVLAFRDFDDPRLSMAARGALVAVGGHLVSHGHYLPDLIKQGDDILCVVLTLDEHGNVRYLVHLLEFRV